MTNLLMVNILPPPKCVSKLLNEINAYKNPYGETYEFKCNIHNTPPNVDYTTRIGGVKGDKSKQAGDQPLKPPARLLWVRIPS